MDDLGCASHDFNMTFFAQPHSGFGLKLESSLVLNATVTEEETGRYLWVTL